MGAERARRAEQLGPQALEHERDVALDRDRLDQPVGEHLRPRRAVEVAVADPPRDLADAGDLARRGPARRGRFAICSATTNGLIGTT
jgi:hypothetical protein